MSAHEDSPVVIVGTGIAGYTVARELRKLDANVPITLVSENDGAFYSKPTLSNALAMKKTAQQLITFGVDAMRTQLRAEIMTHAKVERIDAHAHSVVVNGVPLAFKALVLAVGADARRVPLAGDAAQDVLSVNCLDDYARFRERLRDARSVALLGAGLIGCEFANDLALAGYTVTLIDPAPTPLSRLLPEQAGRAFAQGLTKHGVRLRLATSVDSVEHASTGYTLRCSNGDALDADVVLSAIGLAPRTELAARAGLAIQGGIRTDAWCRASLPDIYAIGDCAAIEGKVQPYVLPIMHAARALAKTLGGMPSRVEFPVMPVTVKTPAAPTVIVPPDEAGNWRCMDTEDNAPHSLQALCEHVADGRALGFALIGSATQHKAAFVKAMTAGKF
jgi:rubredoxin---NAD+ reductase